MREAPKKLITIKQASEMTGFACKTISNKIYSGELRRYGTRGKATLDIEEVKAKLIFGFEEETHESA